MRSDYQKLVDELPGLARDLGERLDSAASGDVAALVRAVECLDRELDSGSAHRRDQLRRDTDRALLGDRIGGELGDALAALYDVLRARDIRESFRRLVVAALANTEAMRHARSATDYIAAIEREAILFVAMTVAVLGDRAGPRLVAFLYAISGPANLWDKFKDAGDDWRNGELAIYPGFALRLRLFARLLGGLPAAAAAHPRWGSLARWGAGWLIAPSQ